MGTRRVEAEEIAAQLLADEVDETDPRAVAQELGEFFGLLAYVDAAGGVHLMASVDREAAALIRQDDGTWQGRCGPISMPPKSLVAFVHVLHAGAGLAVPGLRGEKCGRTACEERATSGPHRDTGLRYCGRCRRRINEEAGKELVVAAGLVECPHLQTVRVGEGPTKCARCHAEVAPGTGTLLPPIATPPPANAAVEEAPAWVARSPGWRLLRTAVRGARLEKQRTPDGCGARASCVATGPSVYEAQEALGQRLRELAAELPAPPDVAGVTLTDPHGGELGVGWVDATGRLEAKVTDRGAVATLLHAGGFGALLLDPRDQELMETLYQERDAGSSALREAARLVALLFGERDSARNALQAAAQRGDAGAQEYFASRGIEWRAEVRRAPAPELLELGCARCRDLVAAAEDMRAAADLYHVALGAVDHADLFTTYRQRRVWWFQVARLGGFSPEVRGGGPAQQAPSLQRLEVERDAELDRADGLADDRLAYMVQIGAARRALQPFAAAGAALVEQLGELFQEDAAVSLRLRAGDLQRAAAVLESIDGKPASPRDVARRLAEMFAEWDADPIDDDEAAAFAEVLEERRRASEAVKAGGGDDFRGRVRENRERSRRGERRICVRCGAMTNVAGGCDECGRGG